MGNFTWKDGSKWITIFLSLEKHRQCGTPLRSDRISKDQALFRRRIPRGYWMCEWFQAQISASECKLKEKPPVLCPSPRTYGSCGSKVVWHYCFYQQRNLCLTHTFWPCFPGCTRAETAFLLLWTFYSVCFCKAFWLKVSGSLTTKHR